MDKEWLKMPWFSKEFINGARRFVQIAQTNAMNSERIVCPCSKCKNLRHHEPKIVVDHLVKKGMDPTYTTWVFHGEMPDDYTVNEDVQILEACRMYKDAFMDGESTVIKEMIESKDSDFIHSIEEAETPLYPSCMKYTKMSALVVLFKHKITNGLSDKGFGEILTILCDMLPGDNTLPNSMYTAKKMLRTFGLGYDKIHACVNDCCLFRKDKDNMDECPKCGSSRWKVDERTEKTRKGVPAKVLRYFPIIPRIRRMFLAKDMEEQLTWHSNNKSKDGNVRHPVDSAAWHNIDQRWPSFASEPRNVRLVLQQMGLIHSQILAPHIVVGQLFLLHIIFLLGYA